MLPLSTGGAVTFSALFVLPPSQQGVLLLTTNEKGTHTDILVGADSALLY